jgi:hypothetical protein
MKLKIIFMIEDRILTVTQSVTGITSLIVDKERGHPFMTWHE